jgi:hypothetical protein
VSLRFFAKRNLEITSVRGWNGVTRGGEGEEVEESQQSINLHPNQCT